MNNANLLGRLTRDPELRYLPNGGQAVVKFTLAVDRKLSKDKKQEAEAKGQPTADFINIAAWGKQAEFVANYLEKGNRAIVQGSIQTGSYVDKDGKRVYTTDIRAYDITPVDWKNSKGNASQGANASNDNWGYQEIANDDDIPF